mgnify:CR=1 FL=1
MWNWLWNNYDRSTEIRLMTFWEVTTFLAAIALSAHARKIKMNLMDAVVSRVSVATAAGAAR